MPQSDADRMKAYRERLRAQEALEGMSHEQAVRDRFGYSASETRSEAERRAAADRIRARARFLTDPDREGLVGYLWQAGESARLLSVDRGETPEQAERRVERAVDYAKWRWDGFGAGQISSL